MNLETERCHCGADVGLRELIPRADPSAMTLRLVQGCRGIPTTHKGRSFLDPAGAWKLPNTEGLGTSKSTANC